MTATAINLKQRLKSDRQEAILAFLADGRPFDLVSRLSRNVDSALTDLWHAEEMPESLALVAVGGYGRGELFPYSDVDILILLDKAPDEISHAKITGFVTRLWDLGLDIGHSSRTVDECTTESEGDITIQTALLESRVLTGNPDLFQELQRRYREQMDPMRFYQAKTLEMRQRHLRHEDTPYSLEPNCKESPGGLRDLQVILWIAKAARLGKSWRGLSKLGLLTPREARQLQTCERILMDVRARLHILTRRREDRLVFDLQAAVAESIGFKSIGNGGNGQRADERLMQRYYRAAKAVAQLNNILLQNIEAELFPQTLHTKAINARFNEVNGLLDIAEDDTMEKFPSAVMEAFMLLAEKPEITGMTARAMRAAWHARTSIDDAFRENPKNKAAFLKIMQAPEGVVNALRKMNESSVLGRYMPAFRKIVGQMQHDLFHIYTVDQHILTVLRNVHRFSLPEHAHEYPFCSQLMADFSKPWLLYFAAFFHDIAKGRNGDHSELGKEDAHEFCQSHGLSEEETNLVVFLVQHHLAMSNTAQKKDLSDPDTILQFAALVKDERHLTALYLLTVADIQGTSPHVWNAWKGKLLEDLFRLTRRALGGDKLESDSEFRSKQNEALKTLRLYGLPANAHESLWEEFDIGYFLQHDANDIAWQTRKLYYKTKSDVPVVHSRLSPIGEGLQVMVYIKDQPDLFARLCSYFNRKNYSILDAKIHTTNHGYALDSFLVTNQIFADNYRDVINLLEHDLTELLKSQKPLPPPSQGRLSRMSRSFPVKPSVDLRPDARGEYFVLSIKASDRTGLLYAIANVLTKYGASVHTAKIVTMGERVEDIFLIECSALNKSRAQIELETDLLEVLRI